MKILIKAAALGCMMLPASVSAQSWNAEQSGVWAFVSSAWERHADADSWHEALDTAGYGWNTDYPVPTGRGEMARRSTAMGAEGRLVYYRIDPVAITVSGDTAIAYYFAALVENDHEGKRQNSREQCADTLVRRSGQWRFLGWMCETTGDED